MYGKPFNQFDWGGVMTTEERGKKIKCIENKGLGAEKKLTIGKIYTVLDSNKYGYKLRDDTNRRRFYDKTRFEITQPQ